MYCGIGYGCWIKAHPASLFAKVHPFWLGIAVMFCGVCLPNIYRPLILSAMARGDYETARRTTELAMAAGVFLMFTVPTMWRTLMGGAWLWIGGIMVCVLLSGLSKLFRRPAG